MTEISFQYIVILTESSIFFSWHGCGLSRGVFLLLLVCSFGMHYGGLWQDSIQLVCFVEIRCSKVHQCLLQSAFASAHTCV